MRAYGVRPPAITVATMPRPDSGGGIFRYAGGLVLTDNLLSGTVTADFRRSPANIGSYDH